MGGLIKPKANNHSNNSNNSGNGNTPLDSQLVPSTPIMNATIPSTPIQSQQPTTPTVTPSTGSRATAVRRKLRLRGRNSDAATTTSSVNTVVNRLEEEEAALAVNMGNGSVSDPSPPAPPQNKQSTRHSFTLTCPEDTVSIQGTNESTTTATTATATSTSTSTTTISNSTSVQSNQVNQGTTPTVMARQVVASATSATAKRLSFFRTRSPSNATDKMAQQQRSHSSSPPLNATSVSTVVHPAAISAAATGTKRRFLFGRSTPSSSISNQSEVINESISSSTHTNGIRSHSPMSNELSTNPHNTTIDSSSSNTGNTGSTSAAFALIST
ncbi:hypothetical protein BDF19DRAFT_438188 [Syncephalis fuscata]|nr:hypothetical protein BDF19DRAFT_438188 [Syncephalis fuscata]